MLIIVDIPELSPFNPPILSGETRKSNSLPFARLSCTHKLYSKRLDCLILNVGVKQELHWCQLNVKPIARLGMNSQSKRVFEKLWLMYQIFFTPP